jgi:IS605 OrfB family transposase
LFSYDTAQQLLHAQLPTGKVVLPVHFPYGQSIVDAAVNQQINLKIKKLCGKPIAWSIEDHGTYFIIKIMVDVPEVAYANFSKISGMIGTDCNYDHFAVTETNGKGQLIKTFTLPFSMDNMSSGQISKMIENKAIALVDHAVKTNKPIAVEKLNTTNSKASLAYGNKKANRKISQFAYDKMISSIKNRAAKCGVSVYEVNPAYTSQIAKMKYMKPLGTSIHQAAAFVIARRAMGFIEKVPPVLFAQLPEEITGKHHWTHWSFLTRTLKKINTHVFYASNFAKPKTLIQPISWLELFDPRVSDLVRQGFVTAK